MNIESMTLDDFLNSPLHCSCGRTHTTEMKTVKISAGALRQVPAIIREKGYKKAFVLADCNTQVAAGAQLLEMLRENDIAHSSLVLDEPELVPDEKIIGSIIMHFDQECDVIIGVGAGTINDISRFLSYRMGLPYCIVATAPSMDGFASTVAPLITDNMKTTYEAHMPQAIIADLDVISQAPMEMIAAGFGDILGKFTCLVDWKLSAIINNEYYCNTIANMMRLALNRTIALKEGLANRDKQAIGKLMESLVLAGIAMSYAGNSRPASGCEHHLSHFWEMRFLFEGRKAVLHGTKVGIATVLMLRLHDYLRNESITIDRIKSSTPTPTDEAWEREIGRVFRQAGDGVIALEKKTGKNLPSDHAQRISVIAERWEEITKVLATLPNANEVAGFLTAVHGPVYPKDVGIDREAIADGIKYAKEIRPRYTVLQLLWDLNLLDEYAEQAVSAEE